MKAVLDTNVLVAGFLAYPRIRAYIGASEAESLLDAIIDGSVVVDDPDDQPSVRSADPDDDFLIALAQHTRSILVSGDSDLLDLSDRIPVMSPTDFALHLDV